MDINQPRYNIVVRSPEPLYKWSKGFNRIQRNFFVEPVKLRREKQIEDFIVLNDFRYPFFITDTDVFKSFPRSSDLVENADIVVITDQKFSRCPCLEIINRIQALLQLCSNVYLCLNKHYINIDNAYHDPALHENFNVAIGQWLKKQLPSTNILDMSLDFVDYGQSFTWAIPDRHFYISCQKS